MSAENKDSTPHDKRVNVFPKAIPGAFPTVHAEKIMVAIDRNNGIATLTLLAMHPQPQIGSEDWILSEVNWDIVGEIKVLIPTMDTLAVYYLQQISNGLNLLPLIQKHIQEHQSNQRPKNAIVWTNRCQRREEMSNMTKCTKCVKLKQ